METNEAVGPLLRGTTAVVTGSTRGIGAAIAKRLAAAGASVVVSGRTEADGQAVVDEIGSDGGNATFKRADVREPTDLKELIDAATNRFGSLDILVNNAAFETDTSPESIDIETWNAIVETDFRAYWLAAKYAHPHLAASDRGIIINISSNHSLLTQPKKFPYNVAKAGVDGMTRSMAVAWGIDDIRVNSINPGWTMVERIADELSDEELRYLDRIHPIGRIGTPEDVAKTALYLASSLSSFVTGQCITVDGGRSVVLQDDLYLQDHGLEPAGRGDDR